MQKSNTPLFLSQSYKDNWDDYIYSVNQPGFPSWDYVVITASNEQQASGFRAQIEARACNLPPQTHFVVIPDEGGVRVGSGGATLSVIRYIRQHEKEFAGLRILVIHSGGDSKRVPQYSALGKLFSPVPRQLPDGRPSTLFDEFLISMAPVPGRIRDGMVLLSGDVLLLFDPLQIQYSGSGAAAISFREPVEIGKNHGVFLPGRDGNVAAFLHKQTVETLRTMGAVDKHDCVNIDTGALIFGTDVLDALYSLVDGDEAYAKLVNETVRLSLYGDFLFPMASGSTLEQFYREKPEGTYNDALMEARQMLWNRLRSFRIKLLRLSPAKFTHFGTTSEVLSLMTKRVQEFSALGWEKQVLSSADHGTACYNSYLSPEASVGENCYLESTYVHPDSKIGDNVILSGVELCGEEIPSNVVIHGLKQRDGKYVARIYAIEDNPKDSILFGKTMEQHDCLWANEERSLWSAKLYPVCDTAAQALAAALNVYAIFHGSGNMEAWKNAQRKSLSQGFADADPEAIIAWAGHMSERIKMEKLAQLIRAEIPVEHMESSFFPSGRLSESQKIWLEEQTERAAFSHAIRLYYYVGKMLGRKEGHRYIRKCFHLIRNHVLSQAKQLISYREDCVISADHICIQSPLRVNWGGGWSDTPPYCLENGGTVLNAAVLLNGEKPVQVTIKRLEEKKIVFDSRDMDVYGEFTEIGPLQHTGDPYDPFALQKAALIACGIIPEIGGDLSQILSRMGGGFCMNSEVANVPKGSGLGTSSILAATCVQALLQFTGASYTQKDVIDRVLCMEQTMGTGGGWQDQVGGLEAGVKLISTSPGLPQNICVEQVELSDNGKRLLADRFCLIYSGQRRLARNILRDVIGRYLGNTIQSITALREIQDIARSMSHALSEGDLARFAQLMNHHWELSKIIDPGTTNAAIDQIFIAIEDLIDGKMICGAGGGGFLQVITKPGVRPEILHQRLQEKFPESGVEVWPCQFVF